MIVIRCPKTDLDVSTGVIVNIKTFTELPANPPKFKCSGSGDEHAWSVRDAMLAGLSTSERASFVPPEHDKR
jgi:hypothetical protein